MTDTTLQKLLSLFDHDEPTEAPTLVEARVIGPAGSDPSGIAIEFSAARDGEHKRVIIRGDSDGMHALGHALISTANELPDPKIEEDNSG